jgi:hypothetical protein
MSAFRSRRRANACLSACRGIPTEALEAGGLQLAIRIARAALGLAPSLAHVDLDLLRKTVEADPSETAGAIETEPFEDEHG